MPSFEEILPSGEEYGEGSYVLVPPEGAMSYQADLLPTAAASMAIYGPQHGDEYSGRAGGDWQPSEPADEPATDQGGGTPPDTPVPPAGGSEFAENPDDRAILHVGDIQVYSLDEGLGQLENIAVYVEPTDVDDRIGQQTLSEPPEETPGETYGDVAQPPSQRAISQPHEVDVPSDSLATARADAITPIILTGRVDETQLIAFHRGDTGEGALVALGESGLVDVSEALIERLEGLLPTVFQEGALVRIAGQQRETEGELGTSRAYGEELADYLTMMYPAEFPRESIQIMNVLPGQDVDLDLATGEFTPRPSDE